MKMKIKSMRRCIFLDNDEEINIEEKDDETNDTMDASGRKNEIV